MLSSSASSPTCTSSSVYQLTFPSTWDNHWNGVTHDVVCFGHTPPVDPLVEEFRKALEAHERWMETWKLRSQSGTPPPAPLRSQCRVSCRPPRTRGKVSFRSSVLERARRMPVEID